MSQIETGRGSARRVPAIPCEPAIDPADWTGVELAVALKRSRIIVHDSAALAVIAQCGPL